MKRLILDRGFLDGAAIGRCKKQWGIDVLIPVRRSMDIYADVVGLAKYGMLDFKLLEPPTLNSKPIPVHRPERIRKREEARQLTLSRLKAESQQQAQPNPNALLRSEVAVVNALKTFSTCP